MREFAGLRLFDGATVPHYTEEQMKRYLCAIVQDRLHTDPRQRALFLFCGKRCDCLKALLWEGDGFLLLYKRMEAQGRFRWPRNSDEVKSLTWQQFDWLISGLEIEQPKAFKMPGNVDNIST